MSIFNTIYNLNFELVSETFMNENKFYFADSFDAM